MPDFPIDPELRVRVSPPVVLDAQLKPWLSFERWR